MEFIGAFLLFVFFVLIMGVFLFAALYFLYVALLSVRALKRKLWEETPCYTMPLKPSRKIIKTYIFVYLAACSIFYAERANKYLLSDRPYKEAKAYAIAGEYLQLWQVATGTFKTADTYFYKTLQYLQRELTLKNIYRLIPENDGEREIWNYKFQLYIYARSFWAPATEEKIMDNFGMLWVFGSYKPQLQTIINSIYDSIIKLDTLSIKDEQFSKTDRYFTIALMVPYYNRYFDRWVNLNYEPKGDINTEGSSWFIYARDPYWIDRDNKLLKAIDDTKEAMDNDKKLYKEFDDNPLVKASLYESSIRAYGRKVLLVSSATDSYKCDTEYMGRFVEYYNDFLDWSQSGSFKKLGKKTQRYSIFVISTQDYIHYIAKYICGRKFNSYSQEEISFMLAKPLTDKELEQYMHRSYRKSSMVLVKKFAEANNNTSNKSTQGE